jgi:hypothetical protein
MPARFALKAAQELSQKSLVYPRWSKTEKRLITFLIFISIKPARPPGAAYSTN